ncbi:MAG: DUF5110 domain-containing protein [Planctomycetes bacterium]|nr:DUF5110 domain-containing protein [Planctomycetota bacterium]
MHGTRTSLRFPLGRDEDIYGFGLDFQRVRQNGSILRLHVDHWGGRPGRTHAPVPFWVSSRGYGVLVDSARYLDVWVGTSLRRDAPDPPPLLDRNRDRNWQAQPSSDSLDVLVPAPGVDVLVFGGPTPLDAVRRFVLYTGGGCLPPRWGLGFTHRTPTSYTAAQVLAEVEEFERRGFPLDFVGLEPGWQSHSYPCSFEWDPERFPEPQGFLTALHGKGVRANLWLNPYVRPGSTLHAELAPYAGSHCVWNGIVPDYEIAAAREIFTGHLDRHAVSLGVAGFKIDEVDGFDSWLWPDTATFPSGLDAEQIRQTYGLRIQRLVDDLYRAHDRRTYGLVRASNAGASRLPFVLYNDHYSHPDFVRALCNSSFCGVLWTPEVRESRTGEEWLRRMQTVCFSPLAMLNAWSSGTRPWSFPEVEEQVREVMLLRLQLQPYLYTAFARYRFEGVPPVRAMPLVEGFATVADAAVRRRFLDDQFVVGDALLVAPLFAGQKKRSVLLPEGDWFDFVTGARVGGGEVVEVGSDTLPVFVRDGALVPLMLPRLHTPAAGERFALEVRHYGRRPGSYRLYDDDGETFAYERGERTWTTLRVERDGDAWRGVVDGPEPPRIASIRFRFMTPP